MKFRNMIMVLLAVLLLVSLCGCGTAQALDAAEDRIEERMDAVEDALQPTALPSATAAPGPTTDTAQTLTREQAEAIALEHAGFTADQVSYLRTEYEIDDGIPQYEVSFHEGRWEYDYEINAETGAIISFEKDD